MSGVKKSTVDEIRARFDQDVDRFSDLETGQSATVDAVLALDLITEAASVATPHARKLIDVGCGAGNFSLKLLGSLPELHVKLIDLSRPMLDRAIARISAETSGEITAVQGDIRNIDLAEQSADIIIAAAVLHHLRSEPEWSSVFQNFYRALKPGGSLWIFDLVKSETPGIEQLLRERYGRYLVELRDQEYRD